MKNSNKMIVMGGLLVVAALTACQGTGTKSTSTVASTSTTGSSAAEDTKDIFVQLVPSNNATTLLSNATKLEPLLKKYTDNEYTFHVSVGTSYGAVNTAVENGKLDAGFLTASGYAQASIEHPGKVEVLLQALRAGYKVQADDFKGDLYDTALREKQRKAMNGEITADGTAVTTANASSAYVYKGDQSSSSVSFYSGIVISRRDSFGSTLTGAKTFDTDKDGTITIKELHAAGTSGSLFRGFVSFRYQHPDRDDPRRGLRKPVRHRVLAGQFESLYRCIPAWFLLDRRFGSHYRR